MTLEEAAIDFVMKFYNVTRDIAIKLYKDEIQAYIQFINMSGTR